MKITNVSANAVRLPLLEPLKWASGHMNYADHVLVRIMTDEGIEGIAESIPRPSLYGDTQESICAIMNKYIGPKLIGMDPLDIDKIWEQMNTVYWNLTPKGAIDVCLYDIMGKKTGFPCYKLLGGYKNKIALSWMIGLKPLEVMVEEAKNKYAEGFRALKLKGGQDADFDIKMFHTIREAVPEDCILYIDANQGWSYADAIKIITQLEGLAAYCEEPIPAWDDHARMKLAREVRTPIMGDESCYTLHDVIRQMEMDTLGLVNIKVPRTGFTLSKKIIAVCEAFNKPCLTGTQAESALGAFACLHLAAASKQISLPSENCYYMSVKGNLIKEIPKVENGYMYVPEKPGLGVELDEAAVEEYTIKLL